MAHYQLTRPPRTFFLGLTGQVDDRESRTWYLWYHTGFGEFPFDVACFSVAARGNKKKKMTMNKPGRAELLPRALLSIQTSVVISARGALALAVVLLLAACGSAAPSSIQPAPVAATQPPAAPTQAPSPTEEAGTETPAPSPPASYPAPSAPAPPLPGPTSPLAQACVPSDLPLPTPPPAPEPPVQAPLQLAPGPIPVYGYTVARAYPHDREAYTQGLVYDRGVLYEGTGQYGRSTLRRVELETGAVQSSCALPDAFFGEGIALYGDKIFQLTWQSRVGFVYAKDSFAPLRAFSYPTEGWGLTHDGARLIMSDGTATLRFLDPDTLEEIGRLDVVDDRGPVERLNELEYVRGEIYANVWQTDRVARIDPRTGFVLGWIDLSGLLGAEDRRQPVDVLNGIAYDPAGDRLFVTGKLWPKLFEITLTPAS
jgi:glutamine cyclotransferase